MFHHAACVCSSAVTTHDGVETATTGVWKKRFLHTNSKVSNKSKLEHQHQTNLLRCTFAHLMRPSRSTSMKKSNEPKNLSIMMQDTQKHSERCCHGGGPLTSMICSFTHESNPWQILAHCRAYELVQKVLGECNLDAVSSPSELSDMSFLICQAPVLLATWLSGKQFVW
eukprot:1305895-Amphidinium_carterae.5